MFPWVYGFTWSAANIIFLGIFFTVVAIVGTTFVFSILRTMKAMKDNQVETIRWNADFHDLPAQLRTCRHQFTGEFKQRTCELGFDCRRCETHAKLVSQHSKNTDAIELPLHTYGFTIPTDRLYHRGHTWIKGDSTGMYFVGLDDLASRLIGTPDGIDLPAVGSKLQVNGSAWSIRRGNTSMRILSPLDGEVAATSDGSDGWFIKIKPCTSIVDTTHLLRDQEVGLWFQNEFERLQGMLTDKQVGLTMADGGTPVQDFVKAYPDKNWDSIMGEVFLES